MQGLIFFSNERERERKRGERIGGINERNFQISASCVFNIEQPYDGKVYKHYKEE